jgi:eukaryotic-like serine/threonine-protein kinase
LKIGQRIVVARSEETLGQEAAVSPVVLEEPIGRGTLGTVWRARDAGGRQVAAKRIPLYGDGELVMLLAADGARLAAVDQPEPAAAALLTWNVVVDGPCALLVMDLMDGGSWADRLVDGGSRSSDEVAAVGASIAASLAGLHAQGLLHGDLKGSAVLFERPGDTPDGVQLADVGIATRFAEAGRFGPLVHGTAGRLDPGVVAGHPFGPPSDVFALGLLCAEMLLGKLPPRRPGSGTPRDPARSMLPRIDRVEGIPPALVVAIGAAMDRRPAFRPTAAEMAATLVALEGGQWRRPANPRLAPVGRAPGFSATGAGGPPVPDTEAEVTTTAPGPTPADDAAASVPPGPLALRPRRAPNRRGSHRPEGRKRAPRRHAPRVRPVARWAGAVAITVILVAVGWRAAVGPGHLPRRPAGAHPVLCPEGQGGGSRARGTPLGEADRESRGCPLRVVQVGEGLEVRSPSGRPVAALRFQPAVPGGQVVTGGFGCDGRVTPALYNPHTGQVFVYLEWPGPGRPVSPARTEWTGVRGGRLVSRQRKGTRCSVVQVLAPGRSRREPPGAVGSASG